MDEDAAAAWVGCNRGAFLFVNLLEAGQEGVAGRVKKWVGGLTKTLAAQKTKGAEILREKLKSV